MNPFDVALCPASCWTACRAMVSQQLQSILRAAMEGIGASGEAVLARGVDVEDTAGGSFALGPNQLAFAADTCSAGSSASLATRYDVPATASWIVEWLGRARAAAGAGAVVERGLDDRDNVALQFPDALLPDAAEVVDELQGAIAGVDAEAGAHTRLFVLGDTSYGSCCVDEVNAQHLSAKLIVHYGHSCLSPTSRIPTRLVFGGATLDADKCVAALRASVDDLAGHSIVVVRDTAYEHAAEAVGDALRAAGCSHVVVPVVHRVLVPADDGEPTSDDSGEASTGASVEPLAVAAGPSAEASGASDPLAAGAAPDASADAAARAFVCGGHTFQLPDAVESVSDVMFLFLGPQCARLTNLLLRFSTSQCYSYDPAANPDAVRLEGRTTNRELQRRFFLMQKASASSVFGIVVGTLAVARYKDVVASCKALIRREGRQAYTFVVGKLNPTKLANFAELVQTFVLVGCPESTLFDSKEYFTPIVTPFELAVAVSDSAEWTGTVTSEFSELLPMLGNATDEAVAGSGAGATAERDSDAESDFSSEANDGDAPVFSTAAGGYVWHAPRGGPDDDGAAPADDGAGAASGAGSAASALTATGSRQLAVRHQSAAAEVLAAKAYRGLDPRIGETAVGGVVEGLVGIAAEYEQEPRRDTDHGAGVTSTAGR